MLICTTCQAELAPDDTYCRRCGKAVTGAGPGAGAPQAQEEDHAAAFARLEAQRQALMPRKSSARKWILLIATGPTLLIPLIFVFVMGGKGCSSVEGTFRASGEPLGTFSMKPVKCKSGQRQGFYGMFILPDKPNKGGLKLVMHPTKGPSVQVELPGSCKPPDFEQCKVVTIDKSACSVFRASVRRTNTRVNRIRLLDGRLKLDCSFEQGGTARADLKLDSCD